MARIGMAVLIAAGLASCSGGDEPDAAAASNSPAASACPSATGTPDRAGTGRAPRDAAGARPSPVAFDRAASTVGAGFDVEFTVFDYKQPAGSACPDADHPGHTWAAVDVQVCAKALPAGFEYVLGWAPWLLAFADGTTIRTGAANLPGFEKPGFPEPEVLPAGQCRRGWITMSVPAGERPVTVVYRSAGSELHAWTVPPPS
jgi:hypothetical protein